MVESLRMNFSTVDETCTILEEDMSHYSDDKRPGAPAAAVARSIIGANLAQACDLVRHMHSTEPQFHEIVERINRTLNLGIELACRGYVPRTIAPEDRAEYELHERDRRPLPSFAHSNEYPLVGALLADSVLRTIAFDTTAPDPWFTTPRPHERSSALSRFGWDWPEPSHPSAAVNAILQARCEVSSTRTFLPTAVAIGGNCLLIPGKAGWRNRSLCLRYYLLDGASDADNPNFPFTARSADVGVKDSYDDYNTAAIDAVNKLMFVAEDTRAKSFSWADTSTGNVYASGYPTHTLNTSEHWGPLSVFAPGRILRAGTGSIAFFNLDEIETHGDLQIDPMKEYEDWAEEESVAGGAGEEYLDDLVEEYRLAPTDSAGSAPTTVIQLADSEFTPSAWNIHPNLPGNMLCAPSQSLRSSIPDYACVSLDLDLAKPAARYLGHAGAISLFSTSETDPNTFLTAAADGYVRLYDTRRALPALSLIAKGCNGAVLVHPEGIPLVFAGSSQDEVVRLWDVRAAKTVCELSTGNNKVGGMAWDAERSVLYVATVCGNLDKNGTLTEGYREAQIDGVDISEARRGVGDDGGFDRDLMDSDLAWPCEAAHNEDYFGALFDAGEHRLFRFAFGEQADPSVLPIYGTARADDY
ncbi:hypothetical protein FB451DRAFT_1093329 [Mycena latifolia]|nr:hypothetical protein FB451DRAFT_1093329 [Mycena latifolia]